MQKKLAVLTLALAMVAASASPRVGAQAAAPDIFDASVLQRVDLWVNSLDWAKLKASFQTNDYYPADFVWNGQTVTNAGIRSRGNGSRSGVKPGLRVDFNRYTDKQEFQGLSSLILRNVTQDPSGIHEGVAMWFHARMGIPAPRVSQARLYVNGEYVGLYSIVEEINKKALSRLFGVSGTDTLNDGYLYEYNYIDDWRSSYLGSALDPYKARFAAKTHESKPDEDLYRPIETLVRLINDTPSSSFVPTVSNRLDLSAFVRFLAVQTFLADNDGFAGNWGINNFYFYRLENEAKHVLIAWDASEAFAFTTFDIAWRFETNVLVRKLLEIPEYNRLYFATLREAADFASERADGSTVGRLETEIRRQLGLIDAAMREDTSKPFTNRDFDNATNAMTQFSSARVAYVRCEADRQTGVSSNTCG